MRRTLLFTSLLLLLPAAVGSQNGTRENSFQRAETREAQQAREKIEALEREKRALLKQLHSGGGSFASGAELSPEQESIKKKEDEIRRSIREYNHPSLQKTIVTPSTKSVGIAMHYKIIQKKIERMGTCKFPTKDGQKVYGDLIVYIPVYQDGTIYQKQGGVRIERSSGNPYLDEAALKIVKDSAPFPPIPKDLRTPENEDVWEVITRFKFTREGDSEAPDVDCTGIR